MRDRTSRMNNVIKADGIGADPAAETDSYPEPQRVVGDKCGPKLMHWEPKP